MESYDEYLNRANWKGSDQLQQWVTNRVISNFARDTSSIDFKGNVLEIGSGIGRGAEAISKLKLGTYTGVEPTSALHKYCVTNLGLDVRKESLPHLDETFAARFDRVFSIHVLEHAPNYLSAHDWVAEMIRVTKPNGYLLIACPNIMDYGSSFWDSDWSHGYPTTPARIKQLLNDFDVEIIDATSLHFGFKSRFAAMLAHGVSMLLPVRMIDVLTMKVIKRPLATGLSIALLWGMTYVCIRKNQD
jgi:SAM-dependent methyltransferase